MQLLTSILILRESNSVAGIVFDVLQGFDRILKSSGETAEDVESRRSGESLHLKSIDIFLDSRGLQGFDLVLPEGRLQMVPYDAFIVYLCIVF